MVGDELINKKKIDSYNACIFCAELKKISCLEAMKDEEKKLQT